MYKLKYLKTYILLKKCNLFLILTIIADIKNSVHNILYLKTNNRAINNSNIVKSSLHGLRSVELAIS